MRLNLLNISHDKDDGKQITQYLASISDNRKVIVEVIAEDTVATAGENLKNLEEALNNEIIIDDASVLTDFHFESLENLEETQSYKNNLNKNLPHQVYKQLESYDNAKATLTFFIAGIYQGWPSPSLVKILSDEYPIEVSEEEASYIAIIGAVGHVFAGFLAAFLSDWIGRKNTILCIALPQIASLTLISFSYYSKILLYVAQILAGMGEGACFAVVPTYIAEISDPDIRGTLGTFSTITVTFGTVFINTIGTYFSIPTAALICHIFPILFWLTFISMPESPYYCLMKDNAEAAQLNLQILRRTQNVTNEVKELTQDVKRQMSERGTFKDLFMVDSNRKAFIIATATRVFQAYTGVAAITAYTQIIILQNTNFSVLLGSTIIFVGKLLTIFISLTYIDRVGRKPMFALGCLACTLLLYSQAIFLTIKDYTDLNVESLLWVPVLLIFLWNVAFAGGLASGVNIYIGEIFSTSIKAKAMSASGVTFALTFMTTVKLYQYTSDNIGASVPFYIFGTFSLIGTVYLAFAIPETKGKTLEAIQQELKGNKS